MVQAAETSPNPMIPRPFRVRKIRKETYDTFTLEIEGNDSGSSFEPGQFNMLYVFGVGEVPISISGNPNSPKTLAHTTREVGMVTRALRGLKPRAVLGVRGPFGNPWPLAEAEGQDVVLVAGGIGLAPLRPVLYALLEHREKYNRVVLLYGTRTPADVLYRHELKEWGRRKDMEVYITVDRAIGAWRGHVGVVPALIPRAPFEPARTVAMVCGPEIMMRFTVEALEKRGVARSRIFLSMERNMKCAIGFCGHCQFGPEFICKNGPVFRFDRIAGIFNVREI